MKDKRSLLAFFTRNRVWTRILSLLLSLVMLFYVIPSVIYGEIADAFSSIGTETPEPVSDTENNPSSFTYEKALFEVEELREESVKHFHLEDGSYVASQYGYPVHYENADGELVDIDNSLYSNGTEFSNINARIKFSKKINGSASLFTLHDGNTKLEMSLVGANKGVAGVVTNGADNESDTELQKMMNLEKLSASILYENVLDGVDLEYIAYSMNIKDNIIVKEKKNEYTYAFELKLNNLWARRESNGDISIFEGEGDVTDPLKYTIPAPVVYDANGEYAPADKAQYFLTHNNGGKYTLTVIVDSEWMNAEERAFPVVVDPTIGSPLHNYAIDLTINSATPSSTDASNAYLYVSSTQTVYYKPTSLPAIPESAYINAAIFTIVHTGIAWNTVAIYEVISDWDDTLTYNKTQSPSLQGTLSDYPVDYMINQSREPRKYFDITRIAKNWYFGGDNFGIALKWIEGESAQYYSSNVAESIYTNRPSIIVNYSNQTGIESYGNYTSFSMGDGGSGNINLATGALSLAISTMATTDNLIPYTVSIVYNSYFANTGVSYPNAKIARLDAQRNTALGFKLNFEETILAENYLNENSETKTMLVHIDSDGTEHCYFNTVDNESVYRDEDGLKLTITKDTTGNTLTMEDYDRNKKVFVANNFEYNGTTVNAWRLSEVVDKIGNKIVFVYTNNKPTSVAMQPATYSSPITMLYIRYNESGAISFIYSAASREGVIFRYSTAYNGGIQPNAKNYLRNVERVNVSNLSMDSVIALENYHWSDVNSNDINILSSTAYEYNDDGYLITIKNELDEKYVELEISQGKVVSVTEYTADDIRGQKKTITYGIAHSTVRSSGVNDIYGDDDDVGTRYVFDNFGRAISVYSHSIAKDDTFYGIVYGATYGDYSEDYLTKNSFNEIVTTGNVYSNQITNGSFEYLDENFTPINWVKSGNVSIDDMVMTDGQGDREIVFYPTANSTSYIQSYNNMFAGTYNISFKYRSQYCENVSAYIEISTYLGTTTKEISLSSGLSTSTNTFTGLTFDASDIDGSTDWVLVKFIVTAGTNVSSDAELRIDAVTVVPGKFSSKHSIVEYGDFHWPPNFTGIIDYWSNDAGTTDGIFGYGNNYGEITAELRKSKYLRQRIYELPEYALDNYDNGNKANNTGLTYQLSGFGMSPSAMASSGIFGFMIEIGYYQGNSGYLRDNIYFHFDKYCTDWQYLVGKFTTGELVNIEPLANRDYSTVGYIDLYCLYSNQLYGYARFDNIAVVPVDASEMVEYTYNEFGLVESKTTLGVTETFEYDGNKNLIKHTLGEKAVYIYTYDDSGINLINVNETVKAVYIDDNDIIHRSQYTQITEYSYDGCGLCTLEKTSSQYSNPSEAQYSQTNYEYYTSYVERHIYGALKRVTHNENELDSFFYINPNTGRLEAEADLLSGNGYYYEYDAFGRIASIIPVINASTTGYTKVENGAYVDYTYDAVHRPVRIETPSTSYHLGYDAFGNKLSTSIDTNTLATYEYLPNNGKLNKVTYGNGFIISYVYDELENISEIWYHNNAQPILAYKYYYGTNNRLSRAEDYINNIALEYTYTDDGILCATAFLDMTANSTLFSKEVKYTPLNEPNNIYYSMIYPTESGMSEFSYSKNYQYDYGEFSLYHIRNDVIDLYYYVEYDGDGRLIYEGYCTCEGPVMDLEVLDICRYYSYSYTSGDYLSNRVSTFTSTDDNSGDSLTYTYTYGNDGNIAKINYSNGKEVRYFYDNLGQMIREDNELLNKTVTYNYDYAGNITSKSTYALTAANVIPSNATSTDLYTYGNTSWGDQLTSYNGTAITYDGIGNPLNYYNGSVFTWNGRKMNSATVGGKLHSFTYGENGLRYSKTTTQGSISAETYYYYDGGKLRMECREDEVFIYFYSEKGEPIAYFYRDGSYADGVFDSFWLEKNLHGDIVAVYSEDNTKLVSYTYDAWGNFTTTYYNGGATTPAAKNPFLYRGYYYDYDLGFYYLQTRYYDANIGRFISADGYISTGQGLTGYNMYAYCNNNPVMFIDPTGEIAWWVVALIVVRVFISAGAVTRIVNNCVYIDNAAAIQDVQGQINQKINEGDSATDAINNYLDAKYENDTNSAPELKGTIEEETIQAVNGYYIDYVDRVAICNILAESGFTERSSRNLGAEWALHNAAAAVSGVSWERVVDVDLDSDFYANEWYTIGGTWLLELLGFR